MERTLPQTCKTKFPNSNELFKFELFITPEDCFWTGGKFKFIIEVPQEYNILVILIFILYFNFNK
jgi:ubiquitin-conjugating enzyme E2 F